MINNTMKTKWNNLSIELIDKILQYDGRIKYRKGEFVNVIHPRDLNFYRFILNSVLEKKINMRIDIQNIINSSNDVIDIENIRNSPNSIVDTRIIDIGHFERNHNIRFINNRYSYTNKFYFEFEFDSLPGVGLCYDFFWGSSYFEICYYDFRNVNEGNHPIQIRVII
jgi:hypothetical protein